MEVKVFGQPACSGCEVVKKMLETNGVTFTYIDVMNPDNMAQAQAAGVRGVPTTVIGEKTIVGSSVKAIQEIRDLVGL